MKLAQRLWMLPKPLDQALQAACACKINGEPCDLRTALPDGCELAILTFDDAEGKHAFWHTASHIMAQAVKRLYPDVKLTIGPAIENGFYYDFDAGEPLTPETLEKIEAEMKQIVKEALPLERFELSPNEAVKLMEAKNEPYKVELIGEHAGKGEPISFYRQGEFTELCAGPHLPDTGRVKAFKLTSCTGAYWRGDAKNQMLQRIYGTAFPKQAALDEYLPAWKRPRSAIIGNLEKSWNCLPSWRRAPASRFSCPKMVLKNLLIDYWREIHREAGYQEISTPMILSRSLWERSGHWAHYKENMYTTVIDEEDYAIKPMNCPGGMLVYKTKPRSYRDLPCGWANWAGAPP